LVLIPVMPDRNNVIEARKTARPQDRWRASAKSLGGLYPIGSY
jgi:hypothetical protein